MYLSNLYTRNQINPIASSTILANRLPSNGGNGSIFDVSNALIVLERFLCTLCIIQFKEANRRLTTQWWPSDAPILLVLKQVLLGDCEGASDWV